MKKYCVVLFAMMFMILLSACGTKAPSEKELKAMVPDEVLQYYFDGVLYTSTIEKFEIMRQRTDENTDISDCKITLKGAEINRTEYITLTSLYWDKGGWMLDNWESYQATEFEPTDNFDTNNFLDEISYIGYRPENLTLLDLSDYPELKSTSKCVYQPYGVLDEHANLTAYGEIIANAKLVTSSEYPKNYNWYIDIDESKMEFVWDIKSVWHGEFNSITAVMNITDMAYDTSPDAEGPLYHLKGWAETQKAPNGKLRHEDFDFYDMVETCGSSLSNLHLRYGAYGIFGLFYGEADKWIEMQFFADYAVGRCASRHSSTGAITYNDFSDFVRFAN